MCWCNGPVSCSVFLTVQLHCQWTRLVGELQKVVIIMMTAMSADGNIGTVVPADVQHRVETALGGALDGDMSIHDVRLVAPNKKMLCLTFRIPAAVAFAAASGPHESETAAGRPSSNDASASGQLAYMESDISQQSKRQRT